VEDEEYERDAGEHHEYDHRICERVVLIGRHFRPLPPDLILPPVEEAKTQV
jgi:hypothetical protein